MSEKTTPKLYTSILEAIANGADPDAIVTLASEGDPSLPNWTFRQALASGNKELIESLATSSEFRIDARAFRKYQSFNINELLSLRIDAVGADQVFLVDREFDADACSGYVRYLSTIGDYQSALDLWDNFYEGEQRQVVLGVAIEIGDANMLRAIVGGTQFYQLNIGHGNFGSGQLLNSYLAHTPYLDVGFEALVANDSEYFHHAHSICLIKGLHRYLPLVTDESLIEVIDLLINNWYSSKNLVYTPNSRNDDGLGLVFRGYQETPDRPLASILSKLSFFLRCNLPKQSEPLIDYQRKLLLLVPTFTDEELAIFLPLVGQQRAETFSTKLAQLGLEVVGSDRHEASGYADILIPLSAQIKSHYGIES